MPPRVYSNGKSQEDVVNEIIEAFDNNDIVLLKGAVGSGKSAIALNTILNFKRGSVITPTKSLEKQYIDDYYTGKYRIGDLDIQVMMGKGNYTCKYKNNGTQCGTPDCPCSKPLKVIEYIDEDGKVRKEKQSRLSVASECPYWSPVYPERFAKHVARKLGGKLKVYDSVSGEYAHILRNNPCQYYKLFESYTHPKNIAIIYNLAKWNIETSIGRKRKVPIEIIDEGDMFLDSLSYKVTISSRLFSSLKKEGLLDENIIKELEKSFKAILFTNTSYNGKIPADISEYINLFLDLTEGETTSGNICDIVNKFNIINMYKDFSYVNIKDSSMDIYIPRPDLTLKELKRRCGKLLLMSATFHTPDILNKIFGITPPIIEAETKFPGTLHVNKVGTEISITNKSWQIGKARLRHFNTLDKIIEKAKRPTLVLVHSYKYAPGNVEFNKPINGGVNWSTVSDRGIDLPDDKCRSLVILKFPFPSLGDPVLQTMRDNMGNSFWNYYRDIANRKLIQQIGRGVRHRDDWVEVWSTDTNVHREIPKLWKGKIVFGK